MLNLNKLSKALRSSRRVRWMKLDKLDYILCDNFVFKTNQEIKGSALTYLIKMFGKVPEEGGEVLATYNGILQDTPDMGGKDFILDSINGNSYEESKRIEETGLISTPMM